MIMRKLYWMRWCHSNMGDDMSHNVTALRASVTRNIYISAADEMHLAALGEYMTVDWPNKFEWYHSLEDNLMKNTIGIHRCVCQGPKYLYHAWIKLVYNMRFEIQATARGLCHWFNVTITVCDVLKWRKCNRFYFINTNHILAPTYSTNIISAVKYQW